MNLTNQREAVIHLVYVVNNLYWLLKITATNFHTVIVDSFIRTTVTRQKKFRPHTIIVWWNISKFVHKNCFRWGGDESIQSILIFNKCFILSKFWKATVTSVEFELRWTWFTFSIPWSNDAFYLEDSFTDGIVHSPEIGLIYTPHLKNLCHGHMIPL